MATLQGTSQRGGRAAGVNGGPQGTLGGIATAAMGAKPGRTVGQIGDAGYLWILVAIEIGFLVYGRAIFKRRHGG